jgi:hypothetical protein
MSKRHKVIIGAAVAGAVAAGVLWVVQARHRASRQTPDWTDPAQPAEGTAGLAASIGLAPAREAWCAARPGDPGLRSGSRIMRTYASNLVDDAESVVR